MGNEKFEKLQFNSREAFADFCVKLKSDNVPFSLSGFQIVIFTKKQFENLVFYSPQSYEAYQDYRRQGLVKKVKYDSNDSLSGRRYLPNEEETEELLKELAEGF